MTTRRAVNRLYGELSVTEAYGAFLIAAARADWRTAGEVASATPHHKVVLERSEFMEWNEGFTALVGEFDRELQISLRGSEAARVAHESSHLQLELIVSLASRMYLSGVAAASDGPVSSDHRDKAIGLAEAVRNNFQRTVEELSEREAAARQSAVDLVLGFESACRAAGVDPDLVIRAHSTTEPEVLEALRDGSPSPNANEWRLAFAAILLEHVGDAAID